MLFNAVGFLLLPFLLKLKIPLLWVAHLYVLIGATAVIALTYFSGGMWSAIYPWIISIPVLALLVVDRTAGIIWGTISFLAMVGFGVLALQGVELPVEYNVEQRTLWFLAILPGLLLIILFISFVFEIAHTNALRDLKMKNKILEEQKQTIAAQSKELENFIEEKDNIIGILAHDLKNPLFNISSLVHFLKTEPNSPDRDKFLELIGNSSRNGLDLIERVLKMNAAEQKEIPLQLSTIDIESLLREILSTMEERVSKKKIKLTLAKASESVDKVVSDKTYLILIFENLISNAIKFSKEGMNIQIAISQIDDEVQVAVVDEGPGIRNQEEALLFKKFKRLSARPTGGESSTGLGLSLVKQYVEILQGKVLYKKNEGNGATFMVQIPLSIAAQ